MPRVNCRGPSELGNVKDGRVEGSEVAPCRRSRPVDLGATVQKLRSRIYYGVKGEERQMISVEWQETGYRIPANQPVEAMVECQ